jgi:hypothetical protein
MFSSGVHTTPFGIVQKNTLLVPGPGHDLSASVDIAVFGSFDWFMAVYHHFHIFMQEKPVCKV